MRDRAVFDETWASKRFYFRKKMTGKKLYLDPESGFMVPSTKKGFNLWRKKLFLERFKFCSNISEILRSIDIEYQTLYDHLAVDKRFREEFNKLIDIPGKVKILNDAIVEASKAEEKALITDLAKKAQNYGG